MNNHDIASILKDTAKLMELHEGNPFKIKSYQNAAFNIDRLETELSDMDEKEMGAVKGIGKSMVAKIQNILSTGELEDLEKMLQDTPTGVIEMMRVKGIGPKKVAVLWKELEIENLGELLYACNENRLIELKGFGEKSQNSIKKVVEFTISNKGIHHYASLEVDAKEISEFIQKKIKNIDLSFTGALRRKCEVLDKIEFVSSANADELEKSIKSSKLLSVDKKDKDSLTAITSENVNVVFYLCNEKSFSTTLFKTTASEEHLSELDKIKKSDSVLSKALNSEEEIYKEFGLAYIEPELREGLDEIKWAKANKLPELIEHADLKGILHNHSTYSDGQNSLQEMAEHCKELGFEYLGICDHSKSAFYANGMSADTIKKQHKEIDELNKKLAPFKILKGIESDILHSGSLDYEDDVLASFDFIVASVHSGLKMDKEKATKRLITAIENPFTTILGHPTGRLLLAREGYPIDHKKVIDACAKNDVVIELNAHPYRLDLDWRWIQYALSKRVMISINPDAHHVDGYGDMYYGVCVARKGALGKAMTFNTKSLKEIEDYFQKRKKNILVS
ncbi:MAG: DNA polymerase/3'-5' exonuclease PolX [Bacteroidia bacterium]|nr:DNA polymerase/3'-5' exonuclease PolX [Bacteroidia bacterium]